MVAIAAARDAILDELQPTEDQLERGLRLHRQAVVCDPVSGGARPWSPAMVERARELMAQHVQPDAMDETLQELADRDVVEHATTRADYVNAWRESGVTLANDFGHMFCAWRTVKLDGLVRDLFITLRSVARTTYVLDQLADSFIKFRHADDVRRAKREGKHCVIFSSGGPPPWLEHDFANLDIYYRLGFRQAQVLYYTNSLGAESYAQRDRGLTDAGVEYVGRLNELGILVDIAHCGDRTSLDVVTSSPAPVINSHTGCKAVHAHPRNVDDELIRAVADSGGVVAIIGGAGRRFLREPLGRVENWLDHVQHAVELVGAEHVACRGSDLSYHGVIPADIREYLYAGAAEPMLDQLEGSFAWTNWPYFTVALATRGFSDDQIIQLIGGSYLRLLEQVCG